MADELKPLLKRIDDLCILIFKLGGDKGVKAKDMEKNFNKGPLSELAFEQHKIEELDTSIEKDISGQTLMNNILKEVKGNGELIAEIKASFEEKSEIIATEANKVSSYAEILQKSADSKKKESHNLQPEKFAKRIISEMKASDRKKNLVFYGVPAHIDEITHELQEYNHEVDAILAELGFSGFEPNYIELLNKPLIMSSDAGKMYGVHFVSNDQFPSEAIALKILKYASYLKLSLTHSRVFIAPDRTLGERKARAKLVEQLKLKIDQQPTIK